MADTIDSNWSPEQDFEFDTGSGIGFNPDEDFGNGQNPPPQSTLISSVEKLMGSDRDVSILTNITTWQGKPVSPRGHFFDVLQSWESFTALNSMWMVFFKIPDIVSDEIMKDWGESIINTGDLKNTGSVNTAKRLLNTPKHQQLIGCAFAQTVTVPTEQVIVDTVGVESRGFLRGPIATRRNSFNPLSIEFFESTVSFTDFIIRPWVVLNSHYGFVARDNPQLKLTTDVVLINFARTGTEFEFNLGTDPLSVTNKRGFIPRKMWLFTGCQPTQISNERYSHEVENSIERRDTEWYFKRYQVMLPTFLEETFRGIESNEVKNAKEFWDASKQGVGETYEQDDSAKFNNDQETSQSFWEKGETSSGSMHSLIEDNQKHQSSEFYPNEQIGRPESTLSIEDVATTAAIMSKALWKNIRGDLRLPGEITTPGDEAYDIQLGKKTYTPGGRSQTTNLKVALGIKPTNVLSGEYQTHVTGQPTGTPSSANLNSISRQMRTEKIEPKVANVVGRPRYDIFGILGF